MKISNDHSNGFPVNSARPAEPDGGVSFRQQFDQALDAASANGEPSAPVAATRSAAAMAPLSAPPVDAHNAINSFESFVDKLGVYQKRLADGRYTLKMLDQDLRGINAHCRHLERLTRDPLMDDALRNLLNEGLATARVEFERFGRGDYC